MTKDLRTLCDEAIQLWDADCDMEGVISEMREALAQPEPQGPTDEELVKHYDRAVTSAIAIRVAVRALTNEDRDAATVAGLRAVLARWGRPAIEPVPVAERLPGPEDCDTERECWWWHPDHKEDEFSDGWMLLKSKWADGHHDADDSPVHTHWLPHHALPVPQQGE